MRQPVQELIERYQKNLYAAAFNICKNQMDAEDVVQETFVQYYTIKKEFENERHRGTACHFIAFCHTYTYKPKTGCKITQKFSMVF